MGKCKSGILRSDTSVTVLMIAGQGMIAGQANVKQLVLVHLPGDGKLEFMRDEASRAFHGPVDIPEPLRMNTL
ncbi:hypothetical protein [Paenibacillus sp. DR312]|uniref:hypothetical protein n=1 Tax=Paenibacillus sp. DR312 TaxID=2871175 RepID=UPI001C95855A|nr:hypothetical protein [Paenibacillus sp. DR312]QZN79027.1 hypothetical protein K5K90_11170 [Paenibacillus sp. DR312]